MGDAAGTRWAAAEACFRHAIDQAQQPGARGSQLPTTVSRCRLLFARAGSFEARAHARQMLAGVYGWFSEGLETRDLQEARQLLAEFN